jgi:hypothetical protein
MRRWIVVALLLVAGPARADEITWEAPRGCPTAEVVRDRVIANLGRPLRDGEVTATLAVARHGRRWKVTMTVRLADAEPGVRTLEAASCEALAESAALILALTIDPFAGEADPDARATDTGEPEMIEIAEPLVASEATDAEVPPVADLTRLHIDSHDEDPPPPMEVSVRARALIGGDLGSLPGPASGWGAAAELGLGPWSIDAGLQQFAEQQAEQPGTPGRGAIVGLTSVDVRGCYTGGRQPWRAGGCIGANAAVTDSIGYGFAPNEPHTTVGAGLGLGAMWAVRIVGPVGIRADLSATWQIARTVLTDDQGMVIHDPDILVWRGFAGLEATWP